MDKDSKEIIELFSSTSDLIKVLGEYVEKRGHLELNNPEIKNSFKFFQENPQKLTELIEKIHGVNAELGKEMMLVIIDVGMINTKLATLELLTAEEKISLGRTLKQTAKRMEKIKAKMKKLKQKKKR